MTNLTHLFKVGQKVKVKNNDFDAREKFSDAVVTLVEEDHVIARELETDANLHFYEGINLEMVFPDYNF